MHFLITKFETFFNSTWFVSTRAVTDKPGNSGITHTIQIARRIFTVCYINYVIRFYKIKKMFKLVCLMRTKKQSIRIISNCFINIYVFKNLFRKMFKITSS